MKILSVALLLISTLLCSNQEASAEEGGDTEGAGKGLRLTVTLKYVETSKDSNWQLLRIEIDKKKMELFKEFGGVDQPKNEIIQKTLDGDLETRIWSFLREHQLDRQIEEVRSTQGLGVAGFLNLEIKAPRRSSLHLVGKTDIWGTDEYVEQTWGATQVESRTNIDHVDYFGKVESLFRFLWTLTK